MAPWGFSKTRPEQFRLETRIHQKNKVEKGRNPTTQQAIQNYCAGKRHSASWVPSHGNHVEWKPLHHADMRKLNDLADNQATAAVLLDRAARKIDKQSKANAEAERWSADSLQRLVTGTVRFLDDHRGMCKPNWASKTLDNWHLCAALAAA
jgi:hypothetical protein